MMIRTFSILFALTLFTGGCATLFSGSNDEITFTSDPPNIKIYKDTRLIGTTPLTIDVKRVGMASGKLNTFKFEKEGYKPQEFTLSTEFNNVALLNNITVVSWLTDFFSGSVTQYSPTDYHVILEQQHQAHAGHFHRRSLTQQYILLYYYDIADNVFREQGVHLDNLMDILEIDAPQRDPFISLLKEQMRVVKTPPDFIIDLDRSMKNSTELRLYAFL